MSLAVNVSDLPISIGQQSLVSYLQKIRAIPNLEHEEEIELANRFLNENDLKAAHRLVSSHLKLVPKIAAGFRGYGLPMGDMISEGNIGLMQAVKRFNPALGFRLATYAMWWIKAAIQEYIIRSWSLVKIGTTAAQKKLFFNLRKLKHRINKLGNVALNQDEMKLIAHDLQVSEEDVAEMDMRIGGHDISLNNAVAQDSDDEIIDLVPETRPNQEALYASLQESEYKKALFYQAFAKLNERERDIIRQRKLNEPAATLKDLSAHYNISQERVRQIEEAAFCKLKNYVLEHRADV